MNNDAKPDSTVQHPSKFARAREKLEMQRVLKPAELAFSLADTGPFCVLGGLEPTRDWGWGERGSLPIPLTPENSRWRLECSGAQTIPALVSSSKNALSASCAGYTFATISSRYVFSHTSVKRGPYCVFSCVSTISFRFPHACSWYRDSRSPLISFKSNCVLYLVPISLLKGKCSQCVTRECLALQ